MKAARQYYTVQIIYLMKNPKSDVYLSGELQLSLKTLARIRELQDFARRNRKRFERLSNRERQILAMVSAGHTNEEIAKLLYRSVNTIRTHRNNIWRQLDIRSIVDAVKWGQAFDLV